jgi:acetylornithine deacetylase
MIGVKQSDISENLSNAVDANWSRQIAWLQSLVRFRSLRGHEAPCQEWLAAEFKSRGWLVDRYTFADENIAGLPGYSPSLRTDIDNAVQVVATVVPTQAPNLPATGNQAGQNLILQGHVDVVPEGPISMWSHPPFGVAIDQGWLYGRGAQDMTMGIAAMVFALDAIQTAGYAPIGKIFVETVTEEESTGSGALSALARGYRADACLIAEPTNNCITRANMGAMWFQLNVRGVPVHVEQAQLGSNAILSAYVLIDALQKLTAKLNEEAKGHRWFAHIAVPRFVPSNVDLDAYLVSLGAVFPRISKHRPECSRSIFVGLRFAPINRNTFLNFN